MLERENRNLRRDFVQVCLEWNKCVDEFTGNYIGTVGCESLKKNVTLNYLQVNLSIIDAAGK